MKSFLKSKTLFFYTFRLAGPGPGAVLAGGLFAVSRLSWQWSMVAEVFTLNNLFIGLLFFLTASFRCAENATQRTKVTQNTTQQMQHTGYVLFNVNAQCCTVLVVPVRLHTGGHYAVAWGSVTSTHWCCMCWSSFLGSFTDCALKR